MFGATQRDYYKEMIPPNTPKKTPIRKRLLNQGRDVNPLLL